MGTAADDLEPDRPPWPPVREVPAPSAVPGTDGHVREPGTDGRVREPGTDGRVREPGTDGRVREPATETRPAPSPAKARPTRVIAPAPTAERRYRQTINRVDLWSVLKVSVCFYICSMAVLLVALIALWVIGDAAGVIRNVETFLGDLLQTKDFTFLDAEILRGALLVSAVLVVLMIVLTVIAAAFYNLFAELFGGVELTITEDETEF